jgi:anti-repressor protein
MSELKIIETNKPMSIEQLLDYNSKAIEKLQKKNREMKPKALFADSVAQSKQSILIGQFAKLISRDDFKIGRNRLFAWFRDNGFLHAKGAEYNQPLQRYKEQGLFETIERTIISPDGSVRLVITTKITGKGQVYFSEKLLAKYESQKNLFSYLR